MIQFTAEKGMGGTLIGLGLSRGNIERLMADKPMRVDLAKMGYPNVEIVIIFGETEQDLFHLLEDGKLITKDTIINPVEGDHPEGF